MKTAVAFFLLMIHLFAATELSQLFKLPVLFKHFEEHKQKEASISFGSFLYRHYFTDRQSDGHPERDNQLPFHSHEDCVSLKLSVFPPVNFEGIVVHVLPLEKNKIFSFSDQNIPLTYLSSIWQPPKQV